MGDRKGKSNKGRHLSKDSASQHPEANTQVIGLQFQTRVDVQQDSQIMRQMMADHKRVLDSLQMDLAEKDEKIENLQQKVKELERKNTDLREEVESKEQEIADLNTKVRALESDKEELQEEVKKVKIEVEQLRAQMKRLQVEKEEEKVKREKLGRDMGTMKKSMAKITQDLAESDHDRASLRKRLTQIEIQRNTYDVGQGEPMTKRSTALIILGEMCHQLQNKMYQEVLPDNFGDDYNHKVKDIKADIVDEEILATHQERDEAANRWGYLQERIGWDDRLIRTIASLIEKRNTSAHPSISEEHLRWALDEMEAKFPKKGYQSAEKVKMLVDMWVKFQVQ